MWCFVSSAFPLVSPCVLTEVFVRLRQLQQLQQIVEGAVSKSVAELGAGSLSQHSLVQPWTFVGENRHDCRHPANLSVFVCYQESGVFLESRCGNGSFGGCPFPHLAWTCALCGIQRIAKLCFSYSYCYSTVCHRSP